MMRQGLQLRLQQKLSPQQIQLMKLVQLPTLAFEQRIKEEIEENPALEELEELYEDNDDQYSDLDDEFSNEYDSDDDYTSRIDTSDINIDEYISDDETPAYRLQANNHSEDDDEYQAPYVASKSLFEYLSEQIHTIVLDDEHRLIAEFLLGCIDEDGYIRRPLDSIVNDLAFAEGIYTSIEEMENVLTLYIQDLDPDGIGARDLRECLLIQLKKRWPSEAVINAMAVLESSFEALSKKHYEKIIQKHQLSKDQLRSVIDEIERLNPRPGMAYNGNEKTFIQVIPDFSIRIIDGDLELSLNGRNAPELSISSSYNEMLRTYKVTNQKSEEQKKAVQFVKQKLDAAKWFIDAVKQRQNTLFSVMNAIMHYQYNYFLSGDEQDIRPMILKDIADKVEMDISTISRVANSKYVNTPYGTMLIKDLFSESITNDEGEEVSTIEIKKILQEVIAAENKQKPLTDEKLVEILKEKGYPVARRTAAKYREQLDIPVARLRKEI